MPLTLLNRSLKPLPTLLALAGLSEAIYLAVFTWPFPLARFYAAVPPLDYAKLTQHSAGGVVLFVGGMLALFLGYLWLLQWQALPTLPSLSPYTGLIFALTLFFGYPTLLAICPTKLVPKLLSNCRCCRNEDLSGFQNLTGLAGLKCARTVITLLFDQAIALAYNTVAEV